MVKKTKIKDTQKSYTKKRMKDTQRTKDRCVTNQQSSFNLIVRIFIVLLSSSLYCSCILLSYLLSLDLLLSSSLCIYHPEVQ